MTTIVVKFIFRSESTVKTVGFYQALGLQFQASQHGGPVHFETVLQDKSILEIYTRQTVPLLDCSLIVTVPSLTETLALLEMKGYITHADTQKRSSFVDGVSVVDPDGRVVIITEQHV
jgi:hypothetical protein